MLWRIKALKSSYISLGILKATDISRTVHLLKKHLRRPESSHLWLTLKVCSSRK